MRRMIFLACLSLVAGCDPGVFGDLEDDASTVALGAPRDTFRESTFGMRIASVRATFGGPPGIEASRVAAVGGTGSGFGVYGIWTASAPDILLKHDGCDNAADACPASFGADVAGIPEWNGDGACFVVTAPETAETRVLCEGGAGNQLGPDAARAGEELGRSVAGIPAAGNPAGVALFGAPGANAGAGALYRLDDGGGAHVPVTLPGAVSLVPGDRFGDAIAADLVPPGSPLTTLTDAVLVAVTASGSDRVHVLALGSDGAGIASELLACLDGGEGFGAALVFGDLTGEGDPELVVGDAVAASGGAGAVVVYSLASLGAGVGCAAADASDDPVGERVACPTGLEVECAGSGFGASLAVGDANADAVGDLLVGAPTATVDGVANAGAAFLLLGNLGGLGGSLTGEADVLVDSDPDANAHLGTAVAMAASHIGVAAEERSEPVASAPGEGRLFVFLCSGLEDIASLADARCLELE